MGSRVKKKLKEEKEITQELRDEVTSKVKSAKESERKAKEELQNVSEDLHYAQDEIASLKLKLAAEKAEVKRVTQDLETIRQEAEEEAATMDRLAAGGTNDIYKHRKARQIAKAIAASFDKSIA